MRRRLARPSTHALMVLVLAAWAPGTQARVDLNVDAETLTALLSTVIPPSVTVPIVGNSRLTVQIDDFRVIGFDPAAGGRGHVLTELRLSVPELGLAVPVNPRLSLQVREEDGLAMCDLVFEEVRIAIPITGTVDIAPVLPKIPIPADNLSGIQTAKGRFQVRTRLAEARTGTKALQLGFDLVVAPMDVPSSKPTPSP